MMRRTAPYRGWSTLARTCRMGPTFSVVRIAACSPRRTSRSTVGMLVPVAATRSDRLWLLSGFGEHARQDPALGV